MGGGANGQDGLHATKSAVQGEPAGCVCATAQNRNMAGNHALGVDLKTPSVTHNRAVCEHYFQLIVIFFFFWTQKSILHGKKSLRRVVRCKTDKLLFLFLATCGGELIGTKGEFHSPNYPANYPSNTNCTWLIQGNKKKKILLTIRSFDFESKWE